MKEYHETTNNVRNYKWWSVATGCPVKRISLTAMFFFAKNYYTYGWWAVSIAAVYIILLFIVLCIASCKFQAINQNDDDFEIWMDYILKILCLFNILFSEMLLYLFYKPLQYNEQVIDVPIDGGQKQIKCEISSIDITSENFLDWVAFISFVIVIVQFIYSVSRSCCCGYKCIKSGCICCNTPKCCQPFCECDRSTGRWKCCNRMLANRPNFGRRRTMSTMSAEYLDTYGRECPFCLIAPHRHFEKYIVFRNIFLVITVLFFLITAGVLVTLFVKVTNIDALQADDEKEGVYIVLVVLSLSFIINPWLWKTCIKCRCQKNHHENQPLLNQNVDEDEEKSEIIETYGL